MRRQVQAQPRPCESDTTSRWHRWGNPHLADSWRSAKVQLVATSLGGAHAANRTRSHRARCQGGLRCLFYLSTFRCGTSAFGAWTRDVWAESEGRAHPQEFWAAQFRRASPKSGPTREGRSRVTRMSSDRFRLHTVDSPASPAKG